MSIHDLVAHFLHENNYHDTLAQFQEEHQYPFEFTDINESLEEIIKDRKSFNEITEQEQTIVNPMNDKFTNWKAPYPQNVTPINILNKLGLLFITIEMCRLSVNDREIKVLILCSTDKQIIIYDLNQNEVLYTLKMPCVIKNTVHIRNTNKLIVSGMDGKVYMISVDDRDISILFDIQCHKRLITNISFLYKGNDYGLLATLGWDKSANFYKVDLRDNQITKFDECKLRNNGSCITSATFKGEDFFLIGEVDSTLINCFKISQNQAINWCKLSINDAEFSTCEFSPMALSISDGEEPFLAVGTSQIPYMRLIIVSLKELEESNERELTNLSIDVPIKRNQIIKNLNTMSPQDKYSSAIICWREDGSGVWIVGDDGSVRGVDVKSERLVEVAVCDGKIKSCCAGDNILVCCGVDRSVYSVN